MRVSRILLSLFLVTTCLGQLSNVNLGPLPGMQFTNRTHRLGRGLVAYYPFNERSGPTAFDLSGNGHDGTLIGGDVIWTPGKFGLGLSFPGTSGDYIDCGTRLGDILGSANKNISVSIWFKADFTGGNDGLFYLGDFASSQGKLHTILHANGIKVFINGSERGVVAFTDTTSWHHYVATYNGIRVKMHLDSVLINDEAFSTAVDFTGAKMIIGAYYSSTLTFDGLIDHVMIYNRALSAGEIALLHKERDSWMFKRGDIELMAKSVAVPPSVVPTLYYYSRFTPLLAIIAFCFILGRKNE